MAFTNLSYTNAPYTIKVYVKDKGLVLSEVSLLAHDNNTQKILAIGEEAKKYLDRPEEYICVTCPFKDGVIADYIITQKIFEHFIHRALGNKRQLIKPGVALCIPFQLTQVEKKAFSDAIYQAGAKKVLIVEEGTEQTFQMIHEDGYKIIIALELEREHFGYAYQKGEEWEEVFKNQIPEDEYSIQSSFLEDGSLTIQLSGQTKIISIKFETVVAVRILEKEAAQKRLYSNSQIEEWKIEKVKNRIYQIKSGEFENCIDKVKIGYQNLENIKHYMLVEKQHYIEIITSKQPDIHMENVYG